MPQMSPMYWMTLMIMFNITLLMINTITYFDKEIMMKKQKKMNKKTMNWKW